MISDVIGHRNSIFRACEHNNLIISYPIFTKLDIINNQPVLMHPIECRHDDVISDVTLDRFPLEFLVFRTCEYYNLRSLHPMFTELDMVDNQPVLTNYIK